LGLVVAYFFAAYHFAYSRGESVGFVQKISHKGWVCKGQAKGVWFKIQALQIRRCFHPWFPPPISHMMIS
jgi:hypothetical protein